MSERNEKKIKRKMPVLQKSWSLICPSYFQYCDKNQVFYYHFAWIKLTIIVASSILNINDTNKTVSKSRSIPHN